MATALFYGIKSDTRALSRDVSPTDMSAYFYLLPLIDGDALVEIEQAEVPAAYFEKLATAIEAACRYDGLVLSYMGFLDYLELTGEVVDLLLRLEGARWVISLGAYQDILHYSVRTRRNKPVAVAIAKAMAGHEGASGGHSTAAGGQLPLHEQPADAIVEQVRQRILAYLAREGVDLSPEEIRGRSLV